MLRTLILLILITIMPWSVLADNKVESHNAGQNPIQESLKLVGEGMMSYLFWDVYLARLYTKTGAYESEVRDTAIEFNYKLDIESKDLVEETIKQWRELELEEHQEEPQWANSLLEIWPDVKEGDQLLFYIDATGHANFYFNNQFRGQIPSKEFSARFKSIWLSEDTTAPKVRRKLLGQSKKKKK